MSDIIVSTEAQEMLAALRDRTEPVRVFAPLQDYASKRTATARAEREREWAASADCTVEVEDAEGRWTVGLVQAHPAETVVRWVLLGVIRGSQVRL